MNIAQLLMYGPKLQAKGTPQVRHSGTKKKDIDAAKVCNECGEFKAADQFRQYTNPRGFTYRRGVCKTCEYKLTRERKRMGRV